jgi:HAD superfamily hydrolase (TIGR01509 family)
MTAALLFDLDGTLVDTDHLHFAAFADVFVDHGVALDLAAYRARVMGFSSPAIAAEFLPHLPPHRASAELARKEAIYRSRIGTLSPTEGITELLDWAEAAGMGRAVVTNAPRANAALVLDALGLAARFDVLVIADELEKSKPDPMPYLVALDRLGASAARSVAFEDSRSGVRSAVAAGLAVVGVLTALDEATLLGLGAAIAARDFHDPRIADLARARAAS